MAALICLPLFASLFTSVAVDATSPTSTAVDAKGSVPLTTATSAGHKRHLTPAEKRRGAPSKSGRTAPGGSGTSESPRPRAPRQEHAAAHAASLAKSPSGTTGAETNIAPSPNFLATCQPSDDSLNCITQELEAVDNAQTQEGLQPTPVNVAAFTQLSAADQMFVLTDLERVIRGLPPVEALTAQLDNVAEQGAVRMTDPALNGWQLTGGKGAIAWDSNWAGGLNTVGSDYFWLYSDGEGYNIDCTPTDQSGCWQHEENILAPIAGSCDAAKTVPQIVMGAGAATTAEYGPSEAEIIVQECGGLPSDAVFTWTEAEQILGIPTT